MLAIVWSRIIFTWPIFEVILVFWYAVILKRKRGMNYKCFWSGKRDQISLDCLGTAFKNLRIPECLFFRIANLLFMLQRQRYGRKIRKSLLYSPKSVQSAVSLPRKIYSLKVNFYPKNLQLQFSILIHKTKKLNKA